MSRETANAARFAKGLCVLTELEGDLLEALQLDCSFCKLTIKCDDCIKGKALNKAHGEA